MKTGRSSIVLFVVPFDDTLRGNKVSIHKEKLLQGNYGTRWRIYIFIRVVKLIIIYIFIRVGKKIISKESLGKLKLGVMMNESNDEEVKIPTIDFCKKELKPGTSQWEKTKEQVFKALQEYGCFVAIYDKVPNEIREAMFEPLKKVLPLKNKIREFNKKPHRYEGQIPVYPFYDDVFHTADLILPESVETFVDTFWPDGNPNYCNVMKSYTKPLMELDEMVKRMVLESLGLNDYIDEFLENSNLFTLRLVEYFKEREGEEEKKAFYGLPTHTDVGFLTIIKQAQPGLQLLMQNNGEWIEPPVSPNSYLVLSADSFMAWTNNRLHSPVHRVKMEGDTDGRLSTVLTSTSKPCHIIEVPKELVDEQHPLLFKPFAMIDYYKYYMSGAKNGLGLEAYFGA